jgi:hypothetical protein
MPKIKGRPRRAAITLPELPSRAGLSPEERVRIRKLSGLNDNERLIARGTHAAQ